MDAPKHSRYILPRPQFPRGLHSARPDWYKGVCSFFYLCNDKKITDSFLKELINSEWFLPPNSSDFDFRNRHDWQIFHGACFYGRLDIVEYMLSLPGFGINNNRNNIHQTVLLSAVWGNQIEVVRRLLQHPLINVNKRGNCGDFPLEIAASKGFIEIVRLLLAHPKIQINQRTKEDRLTDLGRCLEFEVDSDTYTALDLAATRENIDIVKLLLEKGADESNALFHACRRGKEGNVQYLLKHPQITKKAGCLVAAASEGHFWIVIELLKDDSFKDSKTEWGQVEYMAALEEALDIDRWDYYVNESYRHPNLYFNKKICAFELMNYHNKQLARFLTEMNTFAGLPWLPYDILREIHKMARYIHPRLEDNEFRASWKKATTYIPNQYMGPWLEPEIEESGLPNFPRYAFIE